MHVIKNAAGAAQHHEVPVALPKAKHAILPIPLLHFVQQRFIECQILHGRRQCEIQQAEPACLRTAWR